MTRETLAARLNGRAMGCEITDAEAALAKDDGLVVVFGASDDLIEFRGAIEDEQGCYDGGTFYVVDGALADFSEECGCRHEEAARARAKATGIAIEAVWDGDDSDWPWMYRTKIPHATFEIHDDEGAYCRGIVFDLKDAA